MNAQIAIIEDDIDLLELLEYRLLKAGFDVIGFKNSSRVQQFLKEERIDLLLVDRNLPDIEGTDLVKKIKAQGYQVPIIYITAKTSHQEIQEGYLSGADDYVRKPFDMRELIFRIQAVLRRYLHHEKSEILSFRDICINIQTHTVTIEQESITLTKLEFTLLHAFLSQPDQILNREYLLDTVWAKDKKSNFRTVNVAINRLKDKIDPLKEKHYFRTVRGVGYALQ